MGPAVDVFDEAAKLFPAGAKHQAQVGRRQTVKAAGQEAFGHGHEGVDPRRAARDFEAPLTVAGGARRGLNQPVVVVRHAAGADGRALDGGAGLADHDTAIDPERVECARRCVVVEWPVAGLRARASLRPFVPVCTDGRYWDGASSTSTQAHRRRSQPQQRDDEERDADLEGPAGRQDECLRETCPFRALGEDRGKQGSLPRCDSLGEAGPDVADAGVGHRQRQPEARCYLGTFETFDLGHHEYGAGLFVEGLEERSNLCPGLLPRHVGLGVFASDRRLAPQGLVLAGATLFAPMVIGGHATCDLVEPATHGPGLGRIIDLAQEHQEDLLGHVVEVRLVHVMLAKRAAHELVILPVDALELPVAVKTRGQVGGGGVSAHLRGVSVRYLSLVRGKCAVARRRRTRAFRGAFVPSGPGELAASSSLREPSAV